MDKDEGEVAEFGYRLVKDKHFFRRYVVKRIPVNIGDQMEIETGSFHYWVLVTNDHTSDAAALECEHRHKAQVENGVRELKENFGLDVLCNHGFMANWGWLLIVAMALNLTRWTQLLGALDHEGDTRAKRLRYRYLNVPALLVSSGARLSLGRLSVVRSLRRRSRAAPLASITCRLTPCSSLNLAPDSGLCRRCPTPSVTGSGSRRGRGARRKPLAAPATPVGRP